MCHFLSAVFTEDGRLYCDPSASNSHSALMAEHGLKERETDAPVQKFVRLELTPGAKLLDFSTWHERVDEHEVPAWFDKAKRFDAFEQMREILAEAASLKPGKHCGKLVIATTGRWELENCLVIIAGDAHVTLSYCRVVSVAGKANVFASHCFINEAGEDANITMRETGYVFAGGSARVNAYGSVRVQATENAKVVASNHSHVDCAFGSDIRVEASAYAQVTMANGHVEACDHATVILSYCEPGSVTLRHSARLVNHYGHKITLDSRIETLRNKAKADKAVKKPDMPVKKTVKPLAKKPLAKKPPAKKPPAKKPAKPTAKKAVAKKAVAKKAAKPVKKAVKKK